MKSKYKNQISHAMEINFVEEGNRVSLGPGSGTKNFESGKSLSRDQANKEKSRC